MPNYAMSEYLFREFGLDPSTAVPGQIRSTLRDNAGATEDQINEKVGGFKQHFDPVTGAALYDGAVTDFYGGTGLVPHSTYSADSAGSTSGEPDWVEAINRMASGYTDQINTLMGSIGELSANYTAQLQDYQRNNDSLRQQLLSGGFGGNGSHAGVTRARFTNAGRSRQRSAGIATSADNSLGASLI